MYEALVLGLAPYWMCHMGYILSFYRQVRTKAYKVHQFAQHVYLGPFGLLQQSTID